MIDAMPAALRNAAGSRLYSPPWPCGPWAMNLANQVGAAAGALGFPVEAGLAHRSRDDRSLKRNRFTRAVEFITHRAGKLFLR